MHDPAYKQLFARPRMVRDLLDGFVARGWSDDLDLDALEPLPASFVSRSLQQQRYSDLLWRIRFRDGRRLYLMLLLEFQATVDRAMAVRMLTYTGLLYERLAADGALRGRGALPPVLPVVIYNGRRRWTAPVEMRELTAAGRLLAPYQPSQRYHLLDAAHAADADLPSGNLVSALVGLEKTRDRSRLAGPLRVLTDLLRSVDDDHLRQVFAAWLHQGLRASDRFPAGGRDPLAQLEETQTMLEENMREWTREWLDQGRAQGIEQGRAEGIEQERALLCRLAARKFDAGAAEGLAAALAGVTDADRLARTGDWIIECVTASDLLARVRGDGRSGG